MKILGTQFTLETSSFEIYIAGCNGNPHCKGCHNPESWNFDIGEPYTFSYFQKRIYKKIDFFDNMIKNVMIFGGEPLDSSREEIVSLLNDLRKYCPDKKIWIFTHYELQEVFNKLQEDMKKIDYIKTGRYLENLRVEDNIQYGIKLATSNQNIYEINDELIEKYITNGDEEMYRVIINPNLDKLIVKEHADKMKQIRINYGERYCPCVREKYYNEDTICKPNIGCKSFQEQDYEGECYCGLFYKIKVGGKEMPNERK